MYFNFTLHFNFNQSEKINKMNLTIKIDSISKLYDFLCTNFNIITN